MLINSIEVTSPVNNLRKTMKIEFTNDITFIVGENGTGKSTFLKAIFKKMVGDKSSNQFWDNELELSHFKFDVGDNFKEGAIEVNDSVGGLLKTTMSHMDYDNLEMHLASFRLSSGQGLMMQLSGLESKDLSNHVLLLDEPERGLSIRQQVNVFKFIKKLVQDNDGLQVIIVTHGYGLIKCAKEVYSMETDDVVTSELHIKMQLLLSGLEDVSDIIKQAKEENK